MATEKNIYSDREATECPNHKEWVEILNKATEVCDSPETVEVYENHLDRLVQVRQVKLLDKQTRILDQINISLEKIANVLQSNNMRDKLRQSK